MIKIMSDETKIVGTHRRVVLTGVTREPVWSELSGKKLTFLRYAEATSGTFVVYAYGEKLRESAWKKLFAGAETVRPITEFDDCEHYRRLRDEGRLKTLGEPTSKDVAREENAKNAMKKRKLQEAEKHREKAEKQREKAEQQRLEKRQKIKADDKAKYVEYLAWVKEWPADKEFECASLMTKLFEKSVDWRLVQEDRLEYLALMGVSELVMLVDNVNEEPNHQILARAKRARTLSWWNSCFASTRMTVQDALPPTDLEAFYNEQRQAFPKDEFLLHRLCKREQSNESNQTRAIKREQSNESKSNESKSCL